MAGTRTAVKSVALLSIAALAVDLLVIGIITQIVYIVISQDVFGLTGQNRQQWLILVIIPAVITAHFALVEIVFSGRSVGRLCTGLSVEGPAPGMPIPMPVRMARFMNGLKTLGTGSLSLERPASHNMWPESRLVSDWLGSLQPVPRGGSRPLTGPAMPNGNAMPGSTPRPAADPNMRPGLTVTAGPHSGLHLPLPLIKRADQKLFVIGRDPARCHLVLKDDTSVSRIHARIAVRNGHHLIVDGDGRRESTAGTLVNGRKIEMAKPTLLRSGDTIQIGNTTIATRFV